MIEAIILAVIALGAMGAWKQSGGLTGLPKDYFNGDGKRGF